MPAREFLLKRVAEAVRESKFVEFKEEFDVKSTGAWCEILKDLVAMANSGGGVLIVGVANNGALSDADLSGAAALDPAKIGDQIHKYTGVHFSEFELLEVERQDATVLAMFVEESEVPLVFEKPGTYTRTHPATGKPQPRTAFQEGTFYVRHGAKSEPGTSSDLDDFVNRRLDAIRDSWLSGIQKVMEAPEDAEVMIVQATERDAEGHPTLVRVTDDPNAPVFGRVAADVTHPYRQTEVLKELNAHLKPTYPINPYDLLSVRTAYRITPDSHPEFCYKPRFSSPQYSDPFIEWLIKEYKANDHFFMDAREKIARARL
jgi:hypothetical protein